MKGFYLAPPVLACPTTPWGAFLVDVVVDGFFARPEYKVMILSIIEIQQEQVIGHIRQLSWEPKGTPPVPPPPKK